MNKPFLLISITIFFLISSCKKDTFITSADASIDFSSDSLYFDTVFTSAGSITGWVKVFNPNNQKLLLSGIRLMGGNNSSFKINIDGSAGIESNNIELAAHDSLYIFVSVYINPTAANLAFILRDSIRVAFNGNEKYIQLSAWGQNAHFLKNQIISTNTTWTNDRPYVILGGLQVDSNATLMIQEGCRIYVHADAPILVAGTLLAQGDKYDSTRIIFQSDRLDEPYAGYPGSWPGIYFSTSSRDNHFTFAVVKNAYQGLVVQDPAANANPKLTLDQCVIDNIYNEGILGIQSSIEATNCLVTNCGSNIVLGYGGSYHFINCTVASYSNSYVQHLLPVLTLANYIMQGSNTIIAPLNSIFTNCIFWGDNGTVDDEVQVFKQGANPVFNVLFDYCLFKTKSAPSGFDTLNLILNLDPKFQTIDNQKRIYDFHLGDNSPAAGSGTGTGAPTIDLDGNPRSLINTDIGAYQKQ